MALCQPLLLAADGLASYVSAFGNAFRTAVPNWGHQKGRPKLVSGPNIAIVQVVKQRRAQEPSTRHLSNASMPLFANA